MIVIDYTNYKNERSYREVLPIKVFWGATEHHPDSQWLLKAWDYDKADIRHFAVCDIHAWMR